LETQLTSLKHSTSRRPCGCLGTSAWWLQHRSMAFRLRRV